MRDGDTYPHVLPETLRAIGREVAEERDNLTATIGFGCYAGVPAYSVRSANAAWHLVSDPPGSNPFPGKNVVGRVPSQGDAWEWSQVLRGEKGAMAYADFCYPTWRKAPWVTCWTGPNEPPAGTKEEALLLTKFYRYFVTLAHGAGVKIAGGCFSMGRPDENILEWYVPMLRVIDYLAVHEYGKFDMSCQNDLSWLCFRYRRFKETCDRYQVPLPPVIITELGLDNGLGWREQTSLPKFVDQLRWWAGEAAKDSYLLGGILFHVSSYSFPSFLCDEQVCRAVAAINQEHLGTPPNPPQPYVTYGSILEARLTHALYDEHSIRLNPDAALEKALFGDGLLPTSNEQTVEVEGIPYVCQLAQSKNGGPRYVYFCRQGEWGEVKHFIVPDGSS